jgi:hypothetical protein
LDLNVQYRGEGVVFQLVCPMSVDFGDGKSTFRG